MKAISIFLGMVLSLTCFIDLGADLRDLRDPRDPVTPVKVRHKSASDHHGKKDGDFLMIGTGAKNSILLGNNYFYEPAHKHDEEKTQDWQINDPIRVLQTKDKNRFILVNRRTGESMKASILNWD